MRFNTPLIALIVGSILLINAIGMFLSLLMALFFEEQIITILFSVLITTIAGSILVWYGKTNNRPAFNRKDGFLIVTLSWIIMSLSGTLPYLFSGSIDNFTDAFFESLSGYSTTGATIFRDIEILDKSILFWRSLTQWIGGMGFIVLTIAVISFLTPSANQLFYRGITRNIP